jgi:hypothetical protein
MRPRHEVEPSPSGAARSVNDRVITGIRPSDFWNEYAAVLAGDLAVPDRQQLNILAGCRQCRADLRSLRALSAP